MPARCFLALTLDPVLLEPVAAARDAFLDAAPSWGGEKWVRPELQHVTIKFLGPVPDAAVPDMVGALADAALGLGAVTLRPTALRAVPSLRRASMLWALLDGELAAACELHRRVDSVLAATFDIAADTRPYTPHLTLVRSRRSRAVPPDAFAAALGALEAAGKAEVGFPSVRFATLFASTLGPGGPRYESIGEIPLSE